MTDVDVLDMYHAAQDAMGGCGDGNCVVRKQRGQHTNGGCHCMYHPDKLQLMQAAKILRIAQMMEEEIIRLRKELNNDN